MRVSCGPQDKRLDYRNLADVWHGYVRWGGAICEESVKSFTTVVFSADWQPVRKVVDTFQDLAFSEVAHVASLLRKADERLQPLGDPLHLSITNHRWFDPRREREESYSDWLAWLISRMDSSEALRLFALEDTDFGSRVRGQSFDVTREEWISTSSQERKRLDLVVRFEGGGILLVEIKITSIERAGGRENLPLYLGWLNSKQTDTALRMAILLLSDRDDPAPPGWQARLWETVTLGLRRLSQRRLELGSGDSTAPNLLYVATALSFAGAVEQNLLGLDQSGASLAAPQTALYLQEFLEERRS